MPIEHKKQYGIYHWDTFDNETLVIGEADSLMEAESFVKKRYMVGLVITEQTKWIL